MKGMPAKRGKRVSDAEFRRMWLDPDMTAAQIGTALGVSAQAVFSRAKIRGLPPRGNAKEWHITDPLFPAMWAGGVRLCLLAQHYGCTDNVVRMTAKRMGLSRPRVSRHHGLTVAEWQARTVIAAAAIQTRIAMKNAEMLDVIQKRAA